MRKLGTLFEGPRGDVSSKRVFGLGCFIISVALAFMGRGIDVVGAFLGAATLALGLSAVTHT